MTAGRDLFMATYTSNYQLHQWVPGDNFLRTDFQKIDAAPGSIRAQASKAEFVPGTHSPAYGAPPNTSGQGYAYLALK